MSFADSRDRFHRDGFVVVNQFLTPDDVAELTTNLDRYIRDIVPTLDDGDAFYQDKRRTETLKQLQHMGHDEYFEQLRRHPRWTGLAETLLGETVVAKEPEWFNKPPGVEHPTPPHQDNFYFNLQPPNVLTIWLALDPVDEQNGCLRYVPGSHQRGIRSHAATSVLGFSQGIQDFGPDDESSEVVVQLQPGDAVVHHCETIHRADPNRSRNRHRRALAIVFQGTSCRRNEEAWQRYQASSRQQHKSMGLDANSS